MCHCLVVWLNISPAVLILNVPSCTTVSQEWLLLISFNSFCEKVWDPSECCVFLSTVHNVVKWLKPVWWQKYACSRTASFNQASSLLVYVNKERCRFKFDKIRSPCFRQCRCVSMIIGNIPHEFSGLAGLRLLLIHMLFRSVERGNLDVTFTRSQNSLW